MLDRRHLITLLASLGTAALLPNAFDARARDDSNGQGLVALVRQQDGVVAVDPHTGAVNQLVALPAPTATPTGVARSATPAPLVDAGDITYWITAPAGDALVYQRAVGSEISWWWQRVGDEPCHLKLPENLEPAMPSGTVARWFHGATVDAGHLGTGTLRLMAVDITTGRIMMDRAFDRRLELAATAVDADGAAVAHVQGGNTRIEIWAMDLAHGEEMEASIPIQPAAPVAPAAIDLEVAQDGTGVVLAAGLRWDWPGHPAPQVIVAGMASDGSPKVTTVPGELVGLESDEGG